MPTIVPDPINAATPPDTEYVLNIPTEIRALKARVNALAGISGDSINYFRKNLLDNGAFQVLQRINALYSGVSKVYAAAEKFFFWDRWCFQTTAGFTATVSLSSAPDLQAPAGFNIGIGTATAAISDRITMYQRIPNPRLYINKAMRLTVNLNIPAAVLAAGNFTVKAIYNYGTGGSPAAAATMLDTTISTSGDSQTTFAFTTPNVTNAADFGTADNGYIEIQFSWMFITSSTVLWRSAQLEEGSAASPFERLTYLQDLYRCQEHFQTTYNKGVGIGSAAAEAGSIRFQANTAVTTPESGQRFARTMRATPTVLLYSTQTANAPNKVYKETATAGDVAGNSVASNISNAGYQMVTLGAAAIADHFYKYHYTADAELY